MIEAFWLLPGLLALGYMTYSSYRRTPADPRPKPKDDHEHVWEPWSEPVVKDILDDTGENIIGNKVTQQRACLTCGYLDYRLDTHMN